MDQGGAPVSVLYAGWLVVPPQNCLTPGTRWSAIFGLLGARPISDHLLLQSPSCITASVCAEPHRQAVSKTMSIFADSFRSTGTQCTSFIDGSLAWTIPNANVYTAGLCQSDMPEAGTVLTQERGSNGVVRNVKICGHCLARRAVDLAQ